MPELETVPTPLAVAVLIATLIYFWGRWEGWWTYLKRRFARNKVPHAAWCGMYDCSGDCLTEEERDNYEQD